MDWSSDTIRDDGCRQRCAPAMHMVADVTYPSEMYGLTPCREVSATVAIRSRTMTDAEADVMAQWLVDAAGRIERDAKLRLLELREDAAPAGEVAR